jgi:hypothetical protein
MTSARLIVIVSPRSTTETIDLDRWRKIKRIGTGREDQSL